MGHQPVQPLRREYCYLFNSNQGMIHQHKRLI